MDNKQIIGIGCTNKDVERICVHCEETIRKGDQMYWLPDPDNNMQRLDFHLECYEEAMR